MVQRLGEPDRKSILVGTILRDLDESVDSAGAEDGLVYTYDGNNLQVWFEAGKVTSATKDGERVVDAGAQAGGVQLGMSPQAVILRLGGPDRKSVLDGKVLREIDDEVIPSVMGRRLVYTYEVPGLQVWFEDGKVSGVTRHGVSIF